MSTGATTVRHFMADAVVIFHRRFPQVALEFQTENSSRRCMQAVRDHEADLAWVTMGPPMRGVEQRPVLDLPWMVAARTDDPLAARATVRLTDLSRIRHIQLPESSTSRLFLEEGLARHGVRLASTTGAADWDTAILLAELGLGHAVVPAFPGWRTGVAGSGVAGAAGSGVPGAVRLIPVPELPPLPVGWAARQWRAPTPLAAEFAQIVAGCLTPAASPGDAPQVTG